MQHDWKYHLAYWLTALLPVILGFGLTIGLLIFLQKRYKGDDDKKR